VSLFVMHKFRGIGPLLISSYIDSEDNWVELGMGEGRESIPLDSLMVDSTGTRAHLVLNAQS
jgi:hypothetical protein